MYLPLMPAVVAFAWISAVPTIRSAVLALVLAVLTVAVYVPPLVSLLSILVTLGLPVPPVGPETPAVPRVQLSALAQLPGSSGGVLFEVRAALRRLPKGMVVVAVAGTEDLAKRYESWGFTRGTARRIFLRVQ